MFGAPVAYFFEYLLGIKQTERSCGYSEIVISPKAISKFGKMSGSIRTPHGIISVSYKRANGNISFDVTVPKNISAVFSLDEFERKLDAGKNSFSMVY